MFANDDADYLVLSVGNKFMVLFVQTRLFTLKPKAQS